MRIDRLLSQASAAMHSKDGRQSVAILMYHSISDRTETVRHPYFKTVTSPSRFCEQMAWIAESGAEVVPLNNWNSPLPPGRSLRVIITFDDGFADFIPNAFPVLSSHGFPATVFLPTAYIGTGRELLTGVKHLQWSDVERLSQAGISFGSHTATHRPVEKLSRMEIREEIRCSTEEIENRLGGKVTSFSCPFAYPQAHPAVLSALQESLLDYGYTVAVTTKIGTVSLQDEPLSLRRLPVNSEDDRALFMAKLKGGYDWLGGIQRMARGSKKLLNLKSMSVAWTYP